MAPLMRIVDPFGLLPATARLGVRTLEWALATDTAVEVVDVVARSPAALRAAQVALARFDDLAGPIVDRALESPEVWRMIDGVVRSPAIVEAVTSQGIGFADEVADGVGDRTRRADDRLERVARRILHRAPRPTAGSGPFAPPQAP